MVFMHQEPAGDDLPRPIWFLDSARCFYDGTLSMTEIRNARYGNILCFDSVCHNDDCFRGGKSPG